MRCISFGCHGHACVDMPNLRCAPGGHGTQDACVDMARQFSTRNTCPTYAALRVGMAPSLPTIAHDGWHASAASIASRAFSRVH